VEIKTEELLKHFKEMTYTALDFETTGLDPKRDRIVEIGALRFGVQGEFESLSVLVNPGMPISPAASKVNGISDEMLVSCRPVDELIPELCSFLGSSILIAHNAPFDLSFLKEAMKRAGMKRKIFRVVDTRILASQAFPGKRSYSLQNLIRDFSINPGRAHRALDDARACEELFLLCMEKICSRNERTLG
jgi:DNA polymerase-3 subunit epsilon